MDLVSLYEEQMSKYQKNWDQFPWTDSNAYTAWLAQTYYYARHTTRIISFAGSLFPFGDQETHNRFLEHASEEKNHDRLLMSDLRHFGHKPEDFKELTATANLYQTQYYWAMIESPMALFGYFLSLEGLAVTCCKTAVDKLEKVKPGCKYATFLRVHAHDDVEHIKVAMDFAKAAEPKDLDMIKNNLVRTTDNYCQMLNSCKEAASKSKAA